MSELDHRYEDILETQYGGPVRHAHMSNMERAAQFAPFAALTGFGGIISDTSDEHNAHDTFLTSEEIDDI